MKTNIRGALCASVIALTSACHVAPKAWITADHETVLTHAQLGAADRVRNATDQFHDPRVARAAGYSRQFPAGCADSPAGAQGIHFMNEKLVDENVDLVHPELLMYEPQADGELQLVGVDYVVPFALWKSDTPPQLLGMPFMRNEPLGVWALHIWAWRSNPVGMFATWNPGVSCTQAHPTSQAARAPAQ